jgi:hypothetical protein
MYIHLHTHTHTNTHTYTYTYLYTHTYKYTHIHIHIQIHTHTYTYTYTHIHTHTHIGESHMGSMGVSMQMPTHMRDAGGTGGRDRDKGEDIGSNYASASAYNAYNAYGDDDFTFDSKGGLI